ncbi:hypothetical protein FB2170_00285 [Maribacter sp. HTCC2170]|nr:hypothetical protein FB2170_00285 [Maribacter sp. HTCC2170]
MTVELMSDQKINIQSTARIVFEGKLRV